jgi:hypothetical protein
LYFIGLTVLAVDLMMIQPRLSLVWYDGLCPQVGRGRGTECILWDKPWRGNIGRVEPARAVVEPGPQVERAVRSIYAIFGC